jgi:hypothetical protein
MVIKVIEILFVPLHRSFYFIGRAVLSTNSIKEHSLHIAENPKSSLYCEMSVVVTYILYISTSMVGTYANFTGTKYKN